MDFSPFCRGAVLAALIGLVAGCAGTPSSPSATVTSPEGPGTGVAQTPVAVPAAPVKLRALRNTPMPPVRLQIVEVGAPPPTPRVVLVDAPPPPPKVEEIPPRGGGPRQIWLPGHWRYYGRHYVWIGGRWEAPPQPGARYVSPHWESQGKGYLFIEGYWQAT